MAGTRTRKMNFFTKLATEEPPKKKRRAASKRPAASKRSMEPADSCSDPIARKYDVRKISSRELTLMSQELYQAQRINQDLFAMLSFQPELSNAFEQVGAQGVTRPDPDRPRDAIGEWEKILKTQTQFNNSHYFTSKTRDVIYLLETLDKTRQGI